MQLSRLPIKKLVIGNWICCLVLVGYWISTQVSSLTELPQFISTTVDSFGMWAPVIFILLFAIRPLTLFPATILSLSAGALFGTKQALIYLIIAENLSSLTAYMIGKYVGTNLLVGLKNKNALLSNLQKKFTHNSFITILFLRLAYAPFDWVGYYAGASSISYKNFAIATFIGILPGLITSAFLGGAVYDPKNIIISGVFFIFGIVISKVITNNYQAKGTRGK